MKAAFLSVVVVLCLAQCAFGQAPEILSFNHNGYLLAGRMEPGSLATIEWASSPEGPWTNSWAGLQNIVVSSNGIILVRVPMFYRVRGEPAQTPINMVWIEPGTFTMGSAESEQDRYQWEGPQTEVSISQGYWIGRHPVTQGEFLEVTGANPSWFNGSRPTDRDPVSPAGEYVVNLGRPVESVSWHDATNFCALLSAREQNAGRLPDGLVYRLPTEAEWEYACRGGTTSRFSYGDDLTYAGLSTYAWHQGNSDAITHPVGLKSPNPVGLYDMHGNVWEWCLNWFFDYPGGSLLDPVPSIPGVLGVHRGGCWYVGGMDCRSAARGVTPTGYSNGANGFRVVLGSPLLAE